MIFERKHNLSQILFPYSMHMSVPNAVFPLGRDIHGSLNQESWESRASYPSALSLGWLSHHGRLLYSLMTRLHSCATAQGLPPITRKSLCESMEYFQICIGGWPKAGAVRARSELLLTQFVQWANLLEEPPRVGKEFVETLHFTGDCVLQPLYASRPLPEASL